LNIENHLRVKLSAESFERLKWFVFKLIRYWCWVLSRFKPRNAPILFHASIQKTGSSWISDVFKDRRLVNITGLSHFPQGRYEWGKFVHRFPKGCYVPGLFIPFQLFEEIEVPENYHVIYITRDPRAILLSWYWSAKESHTPMGRVKKDRDILNLLSFEDGLLYSVDQLSLKFEYMKSWLVLAEKCEWVSIYKFEEIIKEPSLFFKESLSKVSVDIDESVLSEILADYAIEKQKEKDLKDRGSRGDTSGSGHYNGKGDRWRTSLPPQVLSYLYANTGGLWEHLDYEK
jgi:hypothetical protein